MLDKLVGQIHCLFVLYCCVLSGLQLRAETLVWDPNTESNLAGYRVYYQDQIDSSLSMIDVGNVTNCFFGSLTGGHTYLFAVSAYNTDDVESDLSDFVTYTVPAAGLTVAWEPSLGPGAATYKVSYGLLNKAATTVSAGSALSMNFGNLAAGASYYFYATAYDSGGRVIDSYEQKTFTIPTGGSTSSLSLKRLNRAPAITMNTPGSTYAAPANVVLSCAASDSDGTVRSVDYYSGTTKIGSSTTAPFSITWPGVPGGTYTLSAVATDDDGATTRSANTILTVNALAAPTAFTGTAVSSSSLTLKWTDVTTTETGFYLYRSSNSGAFALIATLGPSVTTYSDSGLPEGSINTYRIASFNASGQSAFTVTPSIVLPPGVPGLFKALVTNSAVQLNWTAAAGAQNYTILRLSTVDSTWKTISTTTALTVTDKTVVAGPIYYYWLTANNSGGQTSASGIKSATLLSTPTAPSGLDASTVAAGVQLTWVDRSTNEDYFIIERALDGVHFLTAGTVAANTTSFVDTAVNSGIRYYYRVRAASVSGATAVSPVLTYTML